MGLPSFFVAPVGDATVEGNTRVPDKAPDIRGMAVKFRQPDGTATDLLGQTSPRFPTDDPEVFVQMTEAAARPTTAPFRLPLFLARNPGTAGALLAGLRAKAVSSPTISSIERSVRARSCSASS